MAPSRFGGCLPGDAGRLFRLAGHWPTVLLFRLGLHWSLWNRGGPRSRFLSPLAVISGTPLSVPQNLVRRVDLPHPCCGRRRGIFVRMILGGQTSVDRIHDLWLSVAVDLENLVGVHPAAHAARRFLRLNATDLAKARRMPTTASSPPRALSNFLSITSVSKERRAFATCRPRPSTRSEDKST